MNTFFQSRFFEAEHQLEQMWKKQLPAQSKKDFISKLSIANKEARETKYWLKLYQSSNLVQIEVDSSLKEIESIINILTKIIKTSSENL